MSFESLIRLIRRVDFIQYFVIAFSGGNILVLVPAIYIPVVELSEVFFGKQSV